MQAVLISLPWGMFDGVHEKHQLHLLWWAHIEVIQVLWKNIYVYACTCRYVYCMQYELQCHRPPSLSPSLLHLIQNVLYFLHVHQLLIQPVRGVCPHLDVVTEYDGVALKLLRTHVLHSVKVCTYVHTCMHIYVHVCNVRMQLSTICLQVCSTYKIRTRTYRYMYIHT